MAKMNNEGAVYRAEMRGEAIMKTLKQKGTYIYDLTRQGFELTRLGVVSGKVAIAAAKAVDPDISVQYVPTSAGISNKYWVVLSQQNEYAIAVYNHDGTHYLYKITELRDGEREVNAAAMTDLDKLIADLNEFADEVERGEYALDSELHKLFRSAAARLASLREYGEAVRKRDADICRAYTTVKSDDGQRSINLYTHHGNEECAAAIESEPLP